MEAPITDEIVKWLKKMGWEERPEIDPKAHSSATSFRFSAGGKFGLNCLIIASEGAGMITLVGSPDFQVPNEQIRNVRDLISRISKEHGNFYLSDEGDLSYIHSRSVGSLPRGVKGVIKQIDLMLDDMDVRVSHSAIPIVGLINGDLSVEDAVGEIVQMEQGN